MRVVQRCDRDCGRGCDNGWDGPCREVMKPLPLPLPITQCLGARRGGSRRLDSRAPVPCRRLAETIVEELLLGTNERCADALMHRRSKIGSCCRRDRIFAMGAGLGKNGQVSEQKPNTSKLSCHVIGRLLFDLIRFNRLCRPIYPCIPAT